MKRSIRKAALLLLTLMICIMAAGCKKETGEEVPTGNVYVPTFTNANVDVEWISSVFSNGKSITLMGDKYEGEDYTRTTTITNIDIDTGETTTKELNLGENTSLSSIIEYQDGYMAILSHYNVPTEEELESGTFEYEEKFEIAIYDADFNQTSSISLDEIKAKVEAETGYFYAQYIAGDAEGRVYVGVDSTMYVIDNTGKILADISFENWLNGLVASDDGQIYALYYDEEYNNILAPVDVQNKTVGKPLENVPSGDGIYPTADGKLYVNSSSKLYLYDPVAQTSEEILDWIACDINSYNLQGFAALDDGSFVAVTTTYDYSGEKTKVSVELANIKEVPASTVKQKKNVTFAMLYLNYDIQEEIIKFNRSSEDYRISVKTYVNDDYSNYEDAYTLFQSDIATGNAADFFMASSGEVNIENLAAKGALTDITELIENDPDISMDDFIPNIITALSIDGKLYSIGESFSVRTLVGKVADVGDGKTWTFKDVMELVKAHPEAELLHGSTKETVMSTMLQFSIGSFYDAATGECHFDSEDFIALLELCNTFPAEYNWDDEEYVSLPTLLRSGKVLLSDVYLSEFDEVQLYKELYGEPVNFIGYPTSGGSGAAAYFNNRFCISSKSKNKDAAWAFIRQFLTQEHQDSLEWNLPVNKASFENRITDAMNVKEDEANSWYYDDVEVKIDSLTEEEAQIVRDIIYGITSSVSYNEQLLSIINEDAAYFFNGEKSAREVAGIIQSRAQLYIDENR